MALSQACQFGMPKMYNTTPLKDHFTFLQVFVSSSDVYNSPFSIYISKCSVHVATISGAILTPPHYEFVFEDMFICKL